MLETVAITRPKRWDHPLDPTMEDRAVEWLLSQPPFSQMDQQRFSNSAPLREVLRNDTRIMRYEPGDIVIREGDYGSSAFLVLTGRVSVLLTKLSASALGRTSSKKLSWWQALKDSLKSNPFPETRNVATVPIEDDPSGTRVRQVDNQPRVYLQDVNAVLHGCESDSLGSGEIFGELAAMTRSPNNFSVVAQAPAILLEIRWQGLRLLRRDPKFKEYLDQRYRANSLQSHLHDCPLLRHIPEDRLALVAAATELISFGEMEWFAEYAQTRKLDIRDQVQSEPIICEEGTPADYLVVLRAGFARLSHKQGDGHRTLAYLGKGQLFGQRELAHNLRRLGKEEPLPYQESLRAVGFVDALRIPKAVAYEHIFPYVRADELWSDVKQPRYDSLGRAVPESRKLNEPENSKTALLEFVVDQRLINGRQAMIIDTERCTRCDDCVKACARTHHGNPRFIRNGPMFGPWMFAHACMHCEDPVCMIGCPTGAIARNPENGVISINPDTCIGCSTCAESCPYQYITMVPIRDEQGRQLVDEKNQLPILQATKCDLCQSQPAGPACQNACPHDALVRIDMSDLRRLGKWIDRKTA